MARRTSNGSGAAHGNAAKSAMPVAGRRRVGEAGPLNMQDHRIEWREGAQPDREGEQLLQCLAAVVEPGCGDQLIDQRPVFACGLVEEIELRLRAGRRPFAGGRPFD
jgi:hypothetical protein